ncbi:MAG: HU family DNA-binding protein [Gemmatimonadaceae bacterium]|nr:HU family DNA-binding protein [Gemmatimonadaceae bacterium]
MTKADLVENVTARIARTAGPTISKKDCARVVDAFLDAIKDALAEQKNIEVRQSAYGFTRRGLGAPGACVQAVQGAAHARG